MAYTAKQLRNGATGDGGEQNSAQAGPGSDVAGLMGTAEAAGNAHYSAPSLQVPPSDGHFEWDSGLAINEGGGSG